MGSKLKYAGAVLSALGLRPGIGADLVALVDSGLWAEAWTVMRDRTSRAAVARRVRSWASVDPQLLWDRLRVLPVPGDPVESVAVWVVMQTWNFARKPVAVRGLAWSGVSPNRTIMYDQPAGPRFGARAATTADKMAAAIDALDTVFWPRLSPIIQADARLATPTWMERHALPTSLPSAGVYVYLDPPYAGTTGYGQSGMTREEVVAVARLWADRGATVAVSEGQDLLAELGSAWEAVDITPERLAQPRSFAKSVSEWLTVHRGET